MLCLKNKGYNKFKWINNVESISNDVGLGYIFANQIGSFDKAYIYQILCDQFITSWFSAKENSSRGQFYGSFKKNLD